MNNFMSVSIWRRTLAERVEDDADAEPRSLLRNALLGFRDRAKFLATEISRDLPEFTCHDITHLDALWELADLICGSEYPVTPSEAFVLGGAFLVHDLGLGLAAYPGGVAVLKARPEWKDIVTERLRQELGRNPTPNELSDVRADIEWDAKVQTLRSLHASRAEHLALASWRDAQSGDDYHLIDNPDMRAIFGKLIGRIAHSHWWPVETIKQSFPEIIGAPAFAPAAWSVDALKIASILRVADVAHLDSTRAPGFLRAIRSPGTESRAHWIFQQHLQKPRLEDGRLFFTAMRPFSIEESDAWWLCFETLRSVELELQRTDALLADQRKPRFAARGVAGVEEPKRLLQWIPTDGWIPVDAHLRVTNVAKLVRTLGGTALYGADQTVPLRELIQNAADAVRARRLLDDQPTWGEILVTIGTDSRGTWVEVEDNGVGMSESVLCKDLLDFGNTYWRSSKMIADLPGLLAKGFCPTGMYGIGFFSVFMWGDHVRVTTRRFEDGRKETRVLEFSAGPDSRACLRPANSDEVLKDGGTRIRAWMRQDPNAEGGLLNSNHRTSPYSLSELCQWLAPALDVDLFTIDESGKQKAIGSLDWISLDPIDLMRRVFVFNSEMDDEENVEVLPRLAANLRPLFGRDGEIVGRACIIPYRLIPGFHGFTSPGGFAGAVMVGGLRACHTYRAAGLLAGASLTAARNLATPVVSPGELSRWATEQVALARNLTDDVDYLIEFADVVQQCEGDTSDLPIAFLGSNAVTRQELAAKKGLPTEVLVMSRDLYSHFRYTMPSFVASENVLATDLGPAGILNSMHHGWPIATATEASIQHSLISVAIRALEEAWGTPKNQLDVSRLIFRGKWTDRNIGSVNGHPVSGHCVVMNRPESNI